MTSSLKTITHYFLGTGFLRLFMIFSANSLLLTILACAPGSTAFEVKLGQEANLAPGESISLTGEPLQIKFVEIVSDSRCPTGVVCVWAGEAAAMVEITFKDSTVSKVLIQPGSSEGTADFDRYTFKFKVQPYPEAGKQIKNQDYRLLITVDAS